MRKFLVKPIMFFGLTTIGGVSATLNLNSCASVEKVISAENIVVGTNVHKFYFKKINLSGINAQFDTETSNNILFYGSMRNVIGSAYLKFDTYDYSISQYSSISHIRWVDYQSSELDGRLIFDGYKWMNSFNYTCNVAPIKVEWNIKYKILTISPKSPVTYIENNFFYWVPSGLTYS